MALDIGGTCLMVCMLVSAVRKQATQATLSEVRSLCQTFLFKESANCGTCKQVAWCLQLPSKVKLRSQQSADGDQGIGESRQHFKKEQDSQQVQTKGFTLPAKPSQLRPAPTDSQVYLCAVLRALV